MLSFSLFFLLLTLVNSCHENRCAKSPIKSEGRRRWHCERISSANTKSTVDRDLILIRRSYQAGCSLEWRWAENPPRRLRKQVLLDNGRGITNVFYICMMLSKPISRRHRKLRDSEELRRERREVQRKERCTQWCIKDTKDQYCVNNDSTMYMVLCTSFFDNILLKYIF